MNKRVVLIAILLLSLLAASVTVMARELTEGGRSRAVSLSPARESAGLAGILQTATGTPMPTPTPAATPGPHVELDAPLTGSAAHPTAAGRAEYDVDRDASSKIEVEVRGLSALAGQTVDVYIDGVLAGSLVVGADGRGEFRANSRDGQTVPVVATDSAIELRLGAAVVAASRFVTDDGDDNDNDNDDDNVNDNDDDNINDNDDDNVNDNDDDNVNDNDDDNINDNDDDNVNDNDDDNVNDNDDDNVNDNDDDNGNDNDDDNANDNHDDNVNDNDDDDHDNDNDDDHGNDNHDDHDNDNDDDDHGGGDDDHGDD
jgi:hypothetical protein